MTTTAESSNTGDAAATTAAINSAALLDLDSPELVALVEAHPQLVTYDAQEVLRLLVENVFGLGAQKRHAEAQLAERDRQSEELSEALRLAELRIHAGEEQINELLGEREDIEQDLAGKDVALEKLRGSLRDSEKHVRELEKRYREQTASVEAERQSWSDQERHYEARIASMRESREGEDDGKKREESLNHSESEVVDDRSRHLQDQLDTLTLAHKSLTSSYKAVQTELLDLKALSRKLQDENESYEVLLKQRTLSGGVFKGEDATQFGEGEDASKAEAQEKEVQEKEPAAAHPSTTNLGSSENTLAESLPVLAAPLPEESALAQRVKHLTDLNKSLADKNKALTLYCTNIIDKILAQDGFERLLLGDGEKRVGIRSADSKRRSGNPTLSPRASDPRRLSAGPGYRASGVYKLGSGHRRVASGSAQLPLRLPSTGRTLQAPENAYKGFRPLSLSASPVVDDAKKESLFARFSSAISGAKGVSFLGGTLTGTPKLSPSPSSVTSPPPPPLPEKSITFGEEEYDEEDEREREKLRKHLAEMGLDSDHIGNKGAWHKKDQISPVALPHADATYTEMPERRRPSKSGSAVGLGIGMPEDQSDESGKPLVNYGPDGKELTWSERMRKVSLGTD